MVCPTHGRPTLSRLLLALAFAAVASPSLAAAPTVDAGRDSTVYSRNLGLFLWGAVTDNGNARDSVKWTQISGPGAAVITARDFEGSKVRFPDTNGVFVLELRGYYGSASYADTVHITVKFVLPRMIAPAEGEIVPVGAPYTIRWHFEPAVNAVQIDSSMSNGLNYDYMLGPVNAPESTSVWHVPADLHPGDTVYLEMFQYQHRDNGMVRMFVLGPSSGVSRLSLPAQKIVSIHTKSGGSLLVGGLDQERDSRLIIGDSRGSIIWQAPARNGIVGIPGVDLHHGRFWYRILCDEELVLGGRLPLLEK